MNYNDLKKFSADFKAVYNAPNESAALSELETIKEKWGKKYPYAISNWESRAHEKGITDAVICAAKNFKIHV